MEEKMARQTQNKTPALKGLMWHRDQYYSFFISNSWHKFSWSDHREGVIYCPDLLDPFTLFAVDIKDLCTTITPDDLETLAEGLLENIEKLPERCIEVFNQKVMGTLLELEAQYSFREHKELRKRWVRVFYHETRQVMMVAQGATRQQYNHWMPWFCQAMTTAKTHNIIPQAESSA
jgi:hypothetical protein